MSKNSCYLCSDPLVMSILDNLENQGFKIEVLENKQQSFKFRATGKDAGIGLAKPIKYKIKRKKDQTIVVKSSARHYLFDSYSHAQEAWVTANARFRRTEKGECQPVWVATHK